MPFPITPTVLTVFTIASTRCSSRSPLAISTVIATSSIIPIRNHLDMGSPARAGQCRLDPPGHVRGTYSDLGYRSKRHRVAHEELCLTRLHAHRVARSLPIL